MVDHFEVVVNGFVDLPVSVFVNPTADIVLDILRSPTQNEGERRFVCGIFIDGNAYLWDLDTCTVEEFMREWKGFEDHDPELVFTIGLDEEEVQVEVNRLFRKAKLFGDLSKRMKVFFM